MKVWYIQLSESRPFCIQSSSPGGIGLCLTCAFVPATLQDYIVGKVSKEDESMANSLDVLIICFHQPCRSDMFEM